MNEGSSRFVGEESVSEVREKRAMQPTLDALDDPDGLLPPLSNGSVVGGKYLVEEVIARGGTGIVLRASHVELAHKVAIKHLNVEARADAAVVERFLREASVAAAIASEHVVRVYDVGTLEGCGPYIVMEHLAGRDLAAVVAEEGPLPISRAVDYALQVCEALELAHAKGIVHRDIKPDNLFLADRPSGEPIVKVVDFGIAKVSSSSSAESKIRKTEASERFGTPVYMSPEQLRSSADVDARADIWALGVVLHELVTGTVPFAGDGIPRICTSILLGTPTPLRRARADAPAELEAIVLKCLEKERDARYASVTDLAKALAPFGSRANAAAVPSPAQKISSPLARVAMPAGVALAMVVACGALVATRTAKTSLPVPHARALAPAALAEARAAATLIDAAPETRRLPSSAEPEPLTETLAPPARSHDGPSVVVVPSTGPKAPAARPIVNRTALFGERQ